VRTYFYPTFADQLGTIFWGNGIDAVIRSVAYKECLLDFSEQLLLFDRISIKVERENLGLFVLVNELGIKQVIDLINEGVVSFTYWTPVITMGLGQFGAGKNDPSLLKGKPPLVSGSISSPIHVDPGESTNYILTTLLRGIKRKDRRLLERKIESSHVKFNLDGYDPAQIVIEAYTDNKLEPYNLPFSKDPDELDYEDRVKLQELSSDVLVTFALSKLEYSNNTNPSYSTLTKESLQKITEAAKIAENFTEIIKIESIPNFKEYLTQKHISLSDVVILRNKRNSKKFRSWLSEVTSNEDGKQICEEYVDSIEGKSGFLNSTKGRLTKSTVFFGISQAIDAFFGGLPVSGLPLGIIDSLLLSKLDKGWNPRLLIKDIKKLESK
jgi:hypothetical protein